VRFRIHEELQGAGVGQRRPVRPARPEAVSHEITIRLPDCRAGYETLRSRGVESLTPPVADEWETRCFFRDPDGHLLEISQAGGWGCRRPP
jgi:catechol 2,3-dioxygenase-like lactoylglutathione lyase family enzyme